MQTVPHRGAVHLHAPCRPATQLRSSKSCWAWMHPGVSQHGLHGEVATLTMLIALTLHACTMVTFSHYAADRDLSPCPHIKITFW